MYSYAVISIHPKTFCVANRGYYMSYREAVNELRNEATDFITKYKRYHTVVYVNSEEEMEGHPDVRYFLKISDQYPNRVEVWDRRPVITKGWIWNGKTFETELVKIFDVISANLPQDNGVALPTNDDYQWVNKLENKTQKHCQMNTNQIELMNELSVALAHRRSKFKSD